jgi:hypothetical protein
MPACDRLSENGLRNLSEKQITDNGYFRTAPFFERDLMFGAVLKKIR